MKFLNHNLFTGDITVSGITTLNTATGVTRTTSDNSTHLATTAFVKNQGYLTTETDTLDSVTDRGSVTTNSIGVGTVNIIGTTAGAELLTVDGTFGRLFTVTDDLSDSLFSVNTVAGLPVIEVFADNTINLGAFSNSIVIDSSSNIVIPGTITASGYNSTNWNTAYNDRIVSAAVTGTTTKTLTLTQTDGGTISTSWTDINTDTDGYISNVSLVGSTLSFTSVGSAFSGIVDLSTLTPTVRTVYEIVKNASGAIIYKGTPLAVVPGQTSGNVSDVVPADAADPTKMPAVFIANQNIADEAEGEAVLFGNLTGVDTSLYQSGTTVYVAPGGGWTATKPVWPNKIQNLGVITKQHATNGAGIVTGVGRANDLPNLTAGKIWVGSANYPIESTTVHIDEVNNRVGIGIANPTGRLHIYGDSSTAWDRHIYLDFEGTDFGAILTDNEGIKFRNITSGNNFYFRNSSNSTTAIITDAGNVGIGTASPSTALEVVGTLRLHDGLDNGRILFRQDRSDVYIQELAFGLTFGAPSGIFFETDTNNNGNGLFNITRQGSSSFYINDSQNVGIGTTSPSQKLHVVGNALVDGQIKVPLASNNGIYLDGFSAATSPTISNNANNTIAYRTSGGNSATGAAHVFNNHLGTTFLGIYNNGNVGIGTTAPSYKLDVNGSINTTEFNINSINQVTGVAYMEPVVSSGFWSRTSATDEWVKVISVSGTPRRIRLSLFAGGDNTNSYEEYMISHSGYGMQTHIHRLPGSRYNTSKVVGIKVINPTGSTQEVWVKLLGMTAAPGDFTYRSNVAVLDSATVAASSQSAEPTSTTGSSVLLFDVTDRNIYTTMSSGGAMFNNDVKLNHGGRIYGNGTSPALFLNNASGSFLEYSTSNRVGVGSGVITLTTGGSERVRVDLLGNVGVGTTTPTKKLEVRQAGIAASFGSTFSPGNFAGIHFGYSEATNDNYKKSALVFERTDNHGQGGNASGKIHFLLNNISSGSATSLAHSVVTIDTDAVATQGSARVGIGTSSPQEAVHVKGNVRIDGSSTAAILETGDKTAGEGGVIFETYDVGTTYGAFVDYVIYDTTRDNMRTGTLRAVWNTGQAVYTDVSTVDIGDTNNVVLYADIDGTNVNLIVNGPTSFTIKYNLKLIK